MFKELVEAMGNIDFLEILFSAFLIAFAAYTFNHLHWVYVEKKKKTTRSGSLLIETVENLQNLALDYWSTDHSDIKNQNNKKKIMEIKIRSLCLLLNSLSADFLEKIPSRTESKHLIQIRQFPSKAFDIASGGEFETNNKKEDYNRCAKISKNCYKMIATVSSLIN